MNQLYLYDSVDNWSIQPLLEAIDTFDESGIALNINSPGGNPESVFGLVAKLQKYKGEVQINVDGAAHSTMLYFLAYYKSNVSALDVSQMVLHRASYGEWYEKGGLTEDERKSLDKINLDLRTALESKIDVAKFEKLTKTTLDQVFAFETRIDVTLTAEIAKKIGLIDTIVKITPEKAASIESKFAEKNAKYIPKLANVELEEKPKSKIKMTLSELKEKHPELVEQVLESERDRVGAWIAYIDVDAKAVEEGIKSNKNLSQTKMAEFSRQLYAKTVLKTTESESVAPVTTKEADPEKSEKTQAQKDLAKIEAEIAEKYNLKK